MAEFVRWFETLDNDEVDRVGGKNASLGEMIQRLREEGVRVPGGFATTAEAYRAFLAENDLDDTLDEVLERFAGGEIALDEAGSRIREAIRAGRFPDEVEEAIRSAYRELCEREGSDRLDIAARSSATAEDLPEASFAGQQETFLNVRGEDAVLDACRRCFASLFTDRAIAYREEQGFGHRAVALSVGIQRMVRADRAGAGVLFTLDTETGFPDVVVIDAAWGLGESVVQGTVNPDAYTVYKPHLDADGVDPILAVELGEKGEKIVYASGGDATTKRVSVSERDRRRRVLDDDEVVRLARWGVAIEKHYDRPMDVEWAKDGDTGELFIVQARPETVQSQKAGTLKAYRLDDDGDVLLEGVAVGDAIAAGPAQIILDADDLDRFEDGSVLVTSMTDPDWVPVMKRAAAIVTERGGRTSHAAIVSRELGIPAVVGTGDASDRLEDAQAVTVSCAEGERGRIYDGELEFQAREVDLDDAPTTRTTIMMNVASPAAAMRWWRLPVAGIGLARMEYLINNVIRAHPLALTRFDEVEDEDARAEIERLTRRFESREEYFVVTLARGIARIAASQAPDPVVVRMSDFKTNEYADLVGGASFEPEEANPMLGFRGAARYGSERYREGFALECRALRRVRTDMGFDNVIAMIPFVRTPEELDGVLELMAENGVGRGEDGLEVYAMVEVPSNVVLAEAFAERVDGFSIGSNDLTQLVLGVDRDSEALADLFDERHEAVRRTIADLIERAHAVDTRVSICGQAPSDHPDFAAFLVEAGIDAMSLNPDSVMDILWRVAEVERAS